MLHLCITADKSVVIVSYFVVLHSEQTLWFSYCAHSLKTHRDTQMNAHGITKSIILNQKSNLAERLGDHLLTPSNVTSTY